jgi:hypothetical protein
MGRLIDADELLKAMDTWDKFGNVPNAGLIPFRTLAVQDIYVPYVKYGDMLKAVNGMSTVEAIPKADYENRLKADLKAILVELQMEIEEYKSDRLVDMERDEMARIFSELIQEKINALKENEDGNR